MKLFSIIKKTKYKVIIEIKKIIWILEYGKNISLGKHISFRRGMIINISYCGKVKIGANTFFNNYCSINSQNKIQIGCDCLFGEGVKIYDHNHIFNTENKISDEGYSVGEVIIGNNCWIGSNVILLKGTRIGNNCTISAGCVISGVIPNNMIIKRMNIQSIEEIRIKG